MWHRLLTALDNAPPELLVGLAFLVIGVGIAVAMSGTAGRKQDQRDEETIKRRHAAKMVDLEYERRTRAAAKAYRYAPRSRGA